MATEMFEILSRRVGYVLEMYGYSSTLGWMVLVRGRTGTDKQQWYDDLATSTIRTNCADPNCHGFCLTVADDHSLCVKKYASGNVNQQWTYGDDGTVSNAAHGDKVITLYVRSKMPAKAADGELWEDPDFPADMSVLPGGDATLVWKRPKEIAINPKFADQGATKFDVAQGRLGNCYAIASVAALAGQPKLLERCVPTNQSFDEEYTGKFEFHFWHGGDWETVYIDDRLPTSSGSLCYAHNIAQPWEFWVPLFEKAYAKFMGGYPNISGGGKATDTMPHFTGVIVERINLGIPDVTPDLDHATLWQVVKTAWNKGALMACNGGGTADVAQNLVGGHEYNISGIQEITRDGTTVKLVRVRNPWGFREWQGKWSDSSDAWNTVSDELKQQLEYVKRDEGENWMEFHDFLAFFTNLQICHLPPEETTESASWNMQSYRFVMAAGIMNVPPYKFTVTPITDIDGKQVAKVHVVISQMHRTLDRSKWLHHTYSVRKLPANSSVSMARINSAEVSWNASMYMTTNHYLLDAGDYTVTPGRGANQPELEYLLRILVEQVASDQFLHLR